MERSSSDASDTSIRSAARVRSRAAATSSETTTSSPALAETGVFSGDDVNVAIERPGRILSLKRRRVTSDSANTLGRTGIPVEQVPHLGAKNASLIDKTELLVHHAGGCIGRINGEDDVPPALPL